MTLRAEEEEESERKRKVITGQLFQQDAHALLCSVRLVANPDDHAFPKTSEALNKRRPQGGEKRRNKSNRASSLSNSTFIGVFKEKV